MMLSILAFAAPCFTEAAFTTRLEWQDNLLQSAKPLEPTPLSDALSTLQRDGVVRIDGQSASVDPLMCANLRRKILEELTSGDSRWESNNGKTSVVSDMTYVPGTRLRFSEPIDVAFGISRHDLLLPLANTEHWPEVQPVLQSAVRQLQTFLVDAVNQILPRLHGSSTEDNDNDHNLEIVEVASLLSRPGSQHQQVHGDYRRFHHSPSLSVGDDDIDTTCKTTNTNHEEEPFANTQERMGKLPPRLVIFVALQDIPTKEHGSTVFVTGTHTAQAHEWVYEGQGIEMREDSNLKAVAAATNARLSILDLSLTNATGVVTASQFNCGDMLVYDASVLHWGGPNSVPDNDRAILYFGVAHPGAAAMLSGEETETLRGMGFHIAPPVVMQDVAASII
jgi:hypothetical protein